MKAYAASCDKNKQAILDVLKRYLPAQKSSVNPPETVLEVGSGTGQHAVYFAEQLAHLNWQPSDRAQQLGDIESWRAESSANNCLAALALDLDDSDWPLKNADHIFTANTVHIVSWPRVIKLLEGVAKTLNPQGYFFIYGPFNYKGQFTCESNAGFDQWLKQRDADSGIRGFESICQNLASVKNHSDRLALIEDVSMPANNRMLVFQKS